MLRELHISSLIVQVRPDRAQDVASALARIDGLDLQQWVGAGKLIVTLETAGTHEIMQRLETINDLPGVISSALVYHQWEHDNEAESETDHETHTSQISQG